jgi:hypothetical protein
MLVQMMYAGWCDVLLVGVMYISWVMFGCLGLCMFIGVAYVGWGDLCWFEWCTFIC